MSLKRAGSWLAAWLLVVAGATSVSAQSEGLRDAQLFAPADFDAFGGGTRANEGLYFVYNGLYWTTSAPAKAPIGKGPDNSRVVFWGFETATRPEDLVTASQGNTMDTGYLNATWSGGEEFNVGFQSGHEGIRWNYFRLHGTSQTALENNIQAYFDDRIWGSGSRQHLDGPVGLVGGTTVVGALPLEFDTVTVNDRNKIWGTGVGYVLRMHPGHQGGIWEWTFGARFIEFREWYDIWTTGGVLADSDIHTFADNRMVGPEIRLRWFQRRERWTISTEAGFTAAANFSTVHQNGLLGSLLGNNVPVLPIIGAPLVMPAMGFTHSEHFEEFSPVVDFRVQLKFNVTEKIAGTVGWSGMWIDNVARPSGMVDYTLYETTVMGILKENHRQDMFMQGLVAGVEINY